VLVNDSIVFHVRNHHEIVIGVYDVKGLRATWRTFYHRPEMSTVRLEKIIVTDLCHVRKSVLPLKCFEIFLDMEFIYTIFEVLGLIKHKFCGFAHTTEWTKLMHGHLLSRYYYILRRKIQIFSNMPSTSKVLKRSMQTFFFLQN